MACCDQKKLKLLLEACVGDKLFEKNLSTTVFKCLLEIVRNSKKPRFYDCFSEKTHKKISKHQKYLKKLVDRKISIKKRKNRFIKCNKKQRKLFYNYIMHDFVNNCVEADV